MSSSYTISRRKIKYISMDWSGIEECPTDIEINTALIPESKVPEIFLYNGSIFMKL